MMFEHRAATVSWGSSSQPLPSATSHLSPCLRNTGWGTRIGQATCSLAENITNIPLIILGPVEIDRAAVTVNDIAALHILGTPVMISGSMPPLCSVAMPSLANIITGSLPPSAVLSWPFPIIWIKRAGPNYARNLYETWSSKQPLSDWNNFFCHFTNDFIEEHGKVNWLGLNIRLAEL